MKNFFPLASGAGMLGLVLAIGFAVSCEPTSAQEGQVPQTQDDQFALVAKTAPEFGGMFLGEDENTLQVYLTDATKLDAVRQAIADVFGANVGPLGIAVLEGRYGFLQLQSWYNSMLGPIWRTPGVTFTDIDEANNRLAIGVTDSAAEAAVLEQLGGLDIPPEAVAIEVTGPIAVTQTVDNPNPSSREGGYIIERLLCNQAGVGITRATLGFNALAARPGAAPVAGFVTVSHATAVWWDLDTAKGFPPAVFYQAPGYYPSQTVGMETRDALGFSGPPCPASSICRYSDSAFVQYDSGVHACPVDAYTPQG